MEHPATTIPRGTVTTHKPGLFGSAISFTHSAVLMFRYSLTPMKSSLRCCLLCSQSTRSARIVGATFKFRAAVMLKVASVIWTCFASVGGILARREATLVSVRKDCESLESVVRGA